MYNDQNKKLILKYIYLSLQLNEIFLDVKNPKTEWIKRTRSPFGKEDPTNSLEGQQDQ